MKNNLTCIEWLALNEYLIKGYVDTPEYKVVLRVAIEKFEKVATEIEKKRIGSKHIQ